MDNSEKQIPSSTKSLVNDQIGIHVLYVTSSIVSIQQQRLGNIIIVYPVLSQLAPIPLSCRRTCRDPSKQNCKWRDKGGLYII